MSAARKATKYNIFCVVTLQARRKVGALSRLYSVTIQIVSWTAQTNATTRNTPPIPGIKEQYTFIYSIWNILLFKILPLGDNLWCNPPIQLLHFYPMLA